MANRVKQVLDYLPFFLLIALTVVYWINYYVADIVVSSRTYIGIAFLMLNAFIYVKHHHIAVLFTGLICILGLLGLIMLSPAEISIRLGSFPLNFGDFCFICIFLLHFILSFRLYIGIATNRYWRKLYRSLKKGDER